VAPGSLAKRCDGSLVLLEGIHFCACSEGEGEGADAGEQICHALGPVHSFFDQPHQDCFCLARSLEEGSWRQPHLGARKGHGWLAGEYDALAVDRDAGNPEARTRRRQLGEQLRRGAYALDHEIETLIGFRHRDPCFAPCRQAAARERI
jgi:hypothetical protein